MKKRLELNNENVIISGVCSGISDYFTIDPIIVRILFLVLSFYTTLPMVIIYLLLSVIIPEKK